MVGYFSFYVAFPMENLGSCSDFFCTSSIWADRGFKQATERRIFDSLQLGLSDSQHKRRSAVRISTPIRLTC